MKQKIAIYLAGSIQKGHENADEAFWTETHMNQLRQYLAPSQVSFLNPASRTDNLTEQCSVFGRDMLQVFCSDFVFVDARDRRGLGVGAEMMWAKFHKIPVITWAPLESHYKKKRTTILGVSVENFVHPFVHCLSDHIVDNLAEGAQWILDILSNPSRQIKGVDCIEEAMRYYKETQFDADVQMKDLISSCDVLKYRAGNMKRTFVQDAV
jgi:hypothetical protein